MRKDFPQEEEGENHFHTMKRVGGKMNFLQKEIFTEN